MQIECTIDDIEATKLNLDPFLLFMTFGNFEQTCFFTDNSTYLCKKGACSYNLVV